MILEFLRKCNNLTLLFLISMVLCFLFHRFIYFSIFVLNSYVTFLNCHFIPIGRIGFVLSYLQVTLTSVLFVLEFCFNLLSIIALTQTITVLIIYVWFLCCSGMLTSLCAWDEQEARQSLCHGSFKFTSTNLCCFSQCNNVALSKNDLQYFCLGHPSYISFIH